MSPRGRGELHGIAPVIFIAAGLLLGCATQQLITLDAEPRPLDVYVDGRLEPDATHKVRLHPDRRHTLYFKKPGHGSQLVVLESNRQKGKWRLEPANVKVRLRPRVSAGADPTPARR